MRIFVAALLVIFGIALIIAAFVVPPMGLIDPTVLTAYAGALFGIDSHYRNRNK